MRRASETVLDSAFKIILDFRIVMKSVVRGGEYLDERDSFASSKRRYCSVDGQRNVNAVVGNGVDKQIRRIIGFKVKDGSRKNA